MLGSTTLTVLSCLRMAFLSPWVILSRLFICLLMGGRLLFIRLSHLAGLEFALLTALMPVKGDASSVTSAAPLEWPARDVTGDAACANCLPQERRPRLASPHRAVWSPFLLSLSKPADTVGKSSTNHLPHKGPLL